MGKQDGIVYIHGLGSSGQGDKATLLRGIFPEILTPDFRGSLDDRMAELETMLAGMANWKIIGSSFGGLMGAMFACRYPSRVERLILLSPALIWPDFVNNLPAPISIPVVVYHGKKDDLISLEAVKGIADKVFLNLTFHPVDDDHGLYQTVRAIDWRNLMGIKDT